jgi:hypothetical protein
MKQSSSSVQNRIAQPWKRGYLTVGILTAGLCAAMFCLAAGMPAPQKYPAQTGNPHGALKIACGRCHTMTSWTPILPHPDFNHQATSYPLRGMHKQVDCSHCHVSLVFSKIGMECADCHADIHRRQLGSDCSQCHSVRGWREVIRKVNDHDNRFPLLGAHVATECESCHRSAAVGLLRGLSTDCAFCHLTDFRNAKTIDHVAAGFSTQCQICHSFDNWAQGFDHSANTTFALTGAHRVVDCIQCHPGGRFAGTPTACVSCHLQDANGTTDPNHTQAGFPPDCSLCHSTAAWSPAVFDRSTTRFPLTGAHTVLQCSACHASGQYAGLPTACDTCHLTDFNTATNPNHNTAGFPRDCTICHGTTAWTPSTFNHGTTAFPLTGAHTTVLCADCHVGGVYKGTPTDCYSCHSKEYDTSTDPNHVAAGFSKQCAQCHSTSSWSGAVFTHDLYPIYSGTHAGRWTSCGDCHPNASNYSAFSCITCHEHDQSTTDSEHRGVSNYVYNPTSCYTCHPSGRGD